MIRKAAMAGLLLISLRAAAQDLSGFEKVLLPVWTPTPIVGLYGAQFSTLFAAQAHDRSVHFYPADGKDVVGVFRPDVRFAEPVPHVAGSTAAGGRLLYVDRNDASSITFGYELASSAAGGSGPSNTALPVVHERDFSSSSIDILAVPTTPVFDRNGLLVLGFRERNALYIYDVDNTGNLAVRVSFGVNSQAPYQDAGMIAATSRDAVDPSYPYYRRIDLDAIVPRCFGGIQSSRPCNYVLRALRVESLTPGIRFWAFVATTDNTTQVVTIHAPQ